MYRILLYFSFSIIVSLASSCISKNKQSILNATICDTTSVKYSATIIPILNNYCLSCHNTSLPSSGVNLDGYSNVLIYVQNGQLWGTMNHNAGYNAMPKDEPKLDNCSLTKIKAWINQGALNN